MSILQQYKLPNWTYTNSVEEYHAAWGELLAVVREFFPQYDVASFDPQFKLTHALLEELFLGVTEVIAMKEYRDRKQAELDAANAEIEALRAEVRKQVFGSRVVFDRAVVERAQKEQNK